jgi:hypothetical protein
MPELFGSFTPYGQMLVAFAVLFLLLGRLWHATPMSLQEAKIQVRLKWGLVGVYTVLCLVVYILY